MTKAVPLLFTPGKNWMPARRWLSGRVGRLAGMTARILEKRATLSEVLMEMNRSSPGWSTSGSRAFAPGAACCTPFTWSAVETGPAPAALLSLGISKSNSYPSRRGTVQLLLGYSVSTQARSASSTMPLPSMSSARPSPSRSTSSGWDAHLTLVTGTTLSSRGSAAPLPA